MSRLAVFASGSGSNFQSLINAVEDKILDADISLLVCDKPEARAIGRAHYHHIPCFSFSNASFDPYAFAEKAKHGI